MLQKNKRMKLWCQRCRRWKSFLFLRRTTSVTCDALLPVNWVKTGVHDLHFGEVMKCQITPSWHQAEIIHWLQIRSSTITSCLPCSAVALHFSPSTFGRPNCSVILSLKKITDNLHCTFKMFFTSWRHLANNSHAQLEQSYWLPAQFSSLQRLFWKWYLTLYHWCVCLNVCVLLPTCRQLCVNIVSALRLIFKRDFQASGSELKCSCIQ